MLARKGLRTRMMLSEADVIRRMEVLGSDFESETRILEKIIDH